VKRPLKKKKKRKVFKKRGGKDSRVWVEQEITRKNSLFCTLTYARESGQYVSGHHLEVEGGGQNPIPPSVREQSTESQWQNPLLFCGTECNSEAVQRNNAIPTNQKGRLAKDRSAHRVRVYAREGRGKLGI